MGVDRAIDITNKEREVILDLLQRHLPGVEAWVYGSRAKWTSRPQSDLDLVVFATPEQSAKVGDLREALEESNLPFRVDLFVWSELPEQLHQEIERDHVVLLGEEKITSSSWEKSVYGKLSGDFRETSLSSLCCDADGVQTGPFGSQLHKKDYVTTGTPIITVEHLGENRVIHKNLPNVSDNDKRRLSKYTLRKGDIVFSRVGSVDRRSLVRDAEDGWLFSGRCLRIRPDPHKIDSGYLSYFFGWESFVEHIRSVAVGATMPSLNTKLLSDILVPVPPLPEQRTIAHTLGTLDDKIELNRRMNETLEAMARALFKSWFVDFDPVRAKMALKQHATNHSPLEGESAKQGRQLEGAPVGGNALTSNFQVAEAGARAYLDRVDPIIAGLFPDRLVDSELGEIPEEWEVGTLDDLAFLNPESWSTKYHPEKLAYVDLTNIKWGYVEQVETFTWQDAPSRARRVLRRGDTIMATVRPGNGSYAFIDENGLTGSTGFAVLRPRDVTKRVFVWCAVTSPESIGRLAGLADGGAYPAVRPSVVAAMPILVPSEKVNREFSRLANPLLNKIETNKREAQLLSGLRERLLPKLISGDLRTTAPDPAIWVVR